VTASSDRTSAHPAIAFIMTGMSETQLQGSDVRTELAEDRTVLANERTFAGWMRTSLACIAIGVGFHALFGKVEPAWLPRAIATAFLVLAVLVIILAERRATAVIERLNSHVVTTARRMNLRLFTAIVSLGAVVFALAIWLLPAT
jgi:putative membrane protein